jgi:hypothetical protein
MKALKIGLRLKRSAALGFASLFALFLVSAQPHRVHHFFEQLGPAHDHGATDSKRGGHSNRPDKTAPTQCFLQAASQHCAGVLVEFGNISTLASSGKPTYSTLSRWVYHFISSPFFQRAPPTNVSLVSI